MRRPDGGRVGPEQASNSPQASRAPKRVKLARAAKVPKLAKQEKPAKLPQYSQPATSARAPRTARKVETSAAIARRELRDAVKARKAFERNESRRFTAHLRRRRITFFVVLGSVLGLGIFIGVGVFSPLMSLQTITVVGAHRVDSSAIIKDLQAQLGRPLPLVDTHSVEATLMKQPLVKSYSTQSIPPHTLVVNIVERAPIGYLDTAQGFSLVDPAGVSIEVTPDRQRELPIIDVKGASPTAHGFPAAVAVLSALPSRVRTQVDRVIATTTDDVSVILKGSNVRVIWGSPDQSSLKATVLATLMRAYPPHGGAIYDVSSPASVVVK